jgi:ABC-type multidrug transport system ATPase subunit
MIELDGVEKRYGRNAVLEVETLKLNEGDRAVLVGPNGSGKTTLLTLLGGIIPATRGSVRWSPELRRGALGYVPQAGGLYAEMTILDNLRTRRALYGMEQTDVQKLHYVRVLGLVPFLDRRFGELSGGYQRLAAIAAALHVRPTWLLLDEPLNGVDRHFRDVLAATLDELGRDLRLMVLTSPTADELAAGDRIIEIEEGRVAC